MTPRIWYLTQRPVSRKGLRLKPSLTVKVVFDQDLAARWAISDLLGEGPAGIVAFRRKGEGLEALLWAPGYNNPSQLFAQETTERPNRGEILVEGDLYRKTGLHMEAWRETGRCVLYQTQGVVTTRGYACGTQRE